MSNTPSPFNNPTLEGFDILHTSPEIVRALQPPRRALVCRYSDPAHRDPRADPTFVLWQEADEETGEFLVIPGSNWFNSEALIKALLAASEVA